MKIQVLSDETINQIAAGEVIERPLSIVKELLENAVDAGASAVSIEIKDGGIAMVRITDNGSGIDREDVRNAFIRHATSKIRDAKDLGNIHTLGFRGEALASIASIASVELITKTPGALMATHYQIDNGIEKDFTEIGAPEGTTFIVRDVFKNIPARRKFLKSPQTEASRIQDIVEKEALAHPEVAFRFIQDGRQKLATLGNGALLDVIYSIYGRDVTNQLIAVNHQYERSALSGIPAVTVRGYVGKPVINRSNRNFEIYFVNGRYVKNPMITKAVEDGFHAFMMQHKFPFTVLMIDVNPEIVDVNVHPQKLEVRFSDGMLVYNSIMDAINLALHQTELIVNTDLEDPDYGEQTSALEPKKLPHVEPFEKERAAETNHTFEEKLRPVIHPAADPSLNLYIRESAEKNTPAADYELKEAVFKPETKTGYENAAVSKTSVAPEPEVGKATTEERNSAVAAGAAAWVKKEDSENRTKMTVQESVQVLKTEQESLFQDRFLSEKAKHEHRIIGQLFETYWLIEYEDKLYIIDQHAAHEKVNFERLMKKLKEKKPVSQYLNPPILLNLSAEEALMMDQYLEYFEGMGYEISNLGGRDYSISAIPADLPEIGKKELLLEILDDLSDETGLTTADSIYYKIASMSCKAAVKGNNRMSLMEADALITELLELDNPYACPHGRPTIISMSKYELEKKFKRIV